MTTPTNTPGVRAIAGRSISSLTKKERAWLKRRTCGWCDAICTATRCQAMYSEPCDMDERRAIWLQSYKPRTHLQEAGDE